MRLSIFAAGLLGAVLAFGSAKAAYINIDDSAAGSIHVTAGAFDLSVMINSTVVKAYLNPLEGGDLPYDFYVWEKVAGSVWGYGIPYLMRSQQKVLNAAWRQMMDNSGVTSGPQIVMKPGVIQPADKQWQLGARKIWYATDDMDAIATDREGWFVFRDRRPSLYPTGCMNMTIPSSCAFAR